MYIHGLCRSITRAAVPRHGRLTGRGCIADAAEALVGLEGGPCDMHASGSREIEERLACWPSRPLNSTQKAWARWSLRPSVGLLRSLRMQVAHAGEPWHSGRIWWYKGCAMPHIEEPPRAQASGNWINYFGIGIGTAGCMHDPLYVRLRGKRGGGREADFKFGSSIVILWGRLRDHKVWREWHGGNLCSGKTWSNCSMTL